MNAAGVVYVQIIFSPSISRLISEVGYSAATSACEKGEQWQWAIWAADWNNPCMGHGCCKLGLSENGLYSPSGILDKGEYGKMAII